MLGWGTQQTVRPAHQCQLYLEDLLLSEPRLCLWATSNVTGLGVKEASPEEEGHKLVARLCSLKGCLRARGNNTGSEQDGKEEVSGGQVPGSQRGRSGL